jgi:hypothetical protein
VSDILQGIIESPQYHRVEVMGMQPLDWPQIEIIETIEKHIALKSAKTIVVRSARQTTKNESDAMLCDRMLHIFKEEGGTYIRTAPTYKPQIVNSKRRVKAFLNKDSVLKNKWKTAEGYIYEYGNAEIQFLSTGKEANVEGATASILLSIDEAHKVDKGKYEEAFGPMTASTAAPVAMWGVAACKQDLLFEYLQKNLEVNPDCVLQYSASIWCELRPAYARHYAERQKTLGADHPVILTQYDLIDVDAIGGFFKPHHITNLLDSQHQQYDSPKTGKEYYVTIDIAGEDEQEELDPLKKSEGQRDSTVCLVWEVDWEKEVNGFPLCMLVNIYWWVGKAFADKGGWPGQQSILLKLLQTWNPHNAVVDSRGIGEQIAKFLDDNYGVEAYAGSPKSVSEDCYGLLAMINNDRVKVYRDNASPERAEIERQLKNTAYEIKQHTQIKIVKPPGKGHIDMAKAMTYLYRVLAEEIGGSFC